MTARDPLRVLALDHYFDQDLKALEAHPALSIRRLPVHRIREPAIRMMGETVAMGFESGLKLFMSDELREARERFARWLDRAMRRIYLEGPFDLIVLPSDIFFYVRALPAVAHSLGLPVVVVQKETTISPQTIEREAPVLRRYAPFISDFMTVSGEQLKDYWLSTGADPASIEITGQPRFDVYAQCAPPTRVEVPTVLFFSYAIDAYVPEHELGQEIWQDLRDETERVLAELATRSRLRVVVKHHPQQDRQGELERLRALAGSAWDVSFVVADPEADTRELVLAADLVVGFQSTAIFEAVAARRPVIYAAWGNAWEERVDYLLPFHQAPPGCLHHANGPDALRTLLQSELPSPSPNSRDWYEEALGHIDGWASDRVAKTLIRIASKWPGEARIDLVKRRRWYLTKLLVRSAAVELSWFTARAPAAILGRGTGVATRQRKAHDLRRLASRELKN